MRLLQVCNIGNILGGTAACAWTVTRALPQVEHAVVFLSTITDETRRAFTTPSTRSDRVVAVEQWQQVNDGELSAIRPEVVLLHNTPPARVGRIASAVTVCYVHSSARHAAADVTVYCSRWIRERCPRPGAVLYQSVSRPPRPATGDTRALRSPVIIGRICTPQARKWPGELPSFYAGLARRFPDVAWEFVGCPAEMQPRLRESCRGRATFHPASWIARSHFWRWDALLYHNPHVTESFGRTAAEAMRAGCVPIVDARGGFVEQIADGTGILCATADEFAAAVDRLRATRERRRISRAALAHADLAFSEERFGREFVQVLRHVASAPALPRAL